MKVTFAILLLSISFFLGLEIRGQGAESFTFFNGEGNRYSDGSYFGDGGLVWLYEGARSPSESFRINGEGIGFGTEDIGARHVESLGIPGGISSLRFEATTYFFGGTPEEREVAVLINGITRGAWQLSAFGQVETFTLNDLEIAGSFDLRIASIGARQVVIDNLSWTEYAEVIRPEPSDFPMNITLTATGARSLEWTWTEVPGTAAADGYCLILGHPGMLPVPVDGIIPEEDLDPTDGSLLVMVSAGTSRYVVSGLPAATTLEGRLYPFSNAGNNIDFRSGPEPIPEVTVRTWFEVFSEDFATLGNWTILSNAAEPGWVTGDGAAAGGQGSLPASGSSFEAWLISPPIDLDPWENASLSFNSTTLYADTSLQEAPLELYAIGEWEPASSLPFPPDWRRLNATLSPLESGTETPSGQVYLEEVQGRDVRIAFRYRASLGTPREGTFWLIEDLEVAAPLRSQPTLLLSVVPSSISEEAAPGSAILQLSLNQEATEAVEVSLHSSDETVATLPANVTLSSGQREVTIPITPVPDGMAAGNRLVTLTVTAEGWITANASLNVVDADLPRFLSIINAPASMAEGDLPTSVSVRLSEPAPEGGLTVSVRAVPGNQIVAPAFMEVPAGALTGVFEISPLFDAVNDGNQTIRLQVEAEAWQSDEESINILDTTATLTLTISPNSVLESDGPGAALLTIRTNGPVPDDLPIALTSTDTLLTEIVLPPSVTIPAEGREINLLVGSLMDDHDDEDQLVSIFASADGWQGASTLLTVIDEDEAGSEIRLTQPLNGTLINLGESLQFQSEVTGEATPVCVRYYANHEPLGNDSLTFAPYAYLWTPTQAGQFEIVAEVTTSEDRTYQSVPILIEVVATSPSIQLLHPVEGSSFDEDEVIALRAQLTDGGGQTTVRFYANGNLIGEDSTAPYYLEWQPESIGQVRLTAQAEFRNTGKIVVSPGVSVTINPAQIQVSLRQPNDNAEIVAGETVIFAVKVNPVTNLDDASISIELDGIEIASGGHLGAGVFEITWLSSQTGEYNWRAILYRPEAIPAESTTRQISILPNLPPLVSIRTPDTILNLPSGSLPGLRVPAEILLLAEATDPESRLSSLVVERDGAAAGEDLADDPGRAAILFPADQAGSYSFRARAVDEAGNVGLSEPITVEVKPTQDALKGGLIMTPGSQIGHHRYADNSDLILTPEHPDNISSWRYYFDGVLIGEIREPPFRQVVSLPSSSVRDHFITVVEEGILGSRVASTVPLEIVDTSGGLPVAELVEPPAGRTFAVGEVIHWSLVSAQNQSNGDTWYGFAGPWGVYLSQDNQYAWQSTHEESLEIHGLVAWNRPTGEEGNVIHSDDLSWFGHIFSDTDANLSLSSARWISGSTLPPLSEVDLFAQVISLEAGTTLELLLENEVLATSESRSLNYTWQETREGNYRFRARVNNARDVIYSEGVEFTIAADAPDVKVQAHRARDVDSAPVVGRVAETIVVVEEPLPVEVSLHSGQAALVARTITTTGMHALEWIPQDPAAEVITLHAESNSGRWNTQKVNVNLAEGDAPEISLAVVAVSNLLTLTDEDPLSMTVTIPNALDIPPLTTMAVWVDGVEETAISIEASSVSTEWILNLPPFVAGTHSFVIMVEDMAERRFCSSPLTVEVLPALEVDFIVEAQDLRVEGPVTLTQNPTSLRNAIVASGFRANGVEIASPWIPQRAGFYEVLAWVRDENGREATDSSLLSIRPHEPLTRDDDFIRQVFRDLLQRNPTEEELAEEEQALATVADRSHWLAEFVSLRGLDSALRAIGGLFRVALGRLPSPVALHVWLAHMTGESEPLINTLEMAGILCRSSEMATELGSELTPATFSGTLFGHGYGQEPTPQQALQGRNRIQTGQTLSPLTTTLEEELDPSELNTLLAEIRGEVAVDGAFDLSYAAFHEALTFDRLVATPPGGALQSLFYQAPIRTFLDSANGFGLASLLWQTPPSKEEAATLGRLDLTSQIEMALADRRYLERFPPAWIEAYPLPDGWSWRSWFGFSWEGYLPWIWHESWGWLYVMGDETNLWLYDPEEGWLWTTVDLYPWYWRAKDGEWLE